MNRRKLLGCAAAVAAALATPFGALAQEYPSRDIHVICAFPPGSGADVLVRHFAEKLRPITKRNIIVENRSGAGGNIATEYVARSKPDGYTIYIHAPSALAANMHLFKKPPVDAGKQIQVTSTFNRQPFMLVVDAKSPFKSVRELTEAMKKKGANATYASAAPTGQIMGEIYKNATGVQAVNVTYKTAPDSLNEMLSGKIDYGMHDPVFSLAQQREGRLKILAVSTGTRLKALPDAPTMSEQGIKMDLTGWWGAMVPTGTPEPVITQINQWITFIAQTPETTKFINSFGGDVWLNSHASAQKVFLEEIKKWGEYVKVAKIEPQ